MAVWEETVTDNWQCEKKQLHTTGSLERNSSKQLAVWEGTVTEKRLFGEKQSQSTQQEVWRENGGLCWCKTQLKDNKQFYTFSILKGPVQHQNKYVSIQELLRCDQFALGLMALSGKVPDISAKHCLNFFLNRIY